MLDQATRLRQLAMGSTSEENQNNTRQGRILTITSGKGGVGKSNIVVNLALTLQKMGKKVLIFDADLGMANDDVLIGCFPKYSIFDIIFSEKEIEDVLVEGPEGIKLLPGGSGLSKIDDLTEVQRERFLNKLESVQGFDYILIDTGAGINRSVLGFIACSDELLIVTTPEPTSLTDAYSLLKAVSHFQIKKSARVIVNRVLDYKEGRVTFNKFNNAAEKFLHVTLTHLGSVSEDKKVMQSVRMQKPLVISYPNSIPSGDIKVMAEELEGFSYRTSSGDNGVHGLFKKIFKIFS